MIAPYKRHPSPPRVAILTPEGEAISEHGLRLDLDDWPTNHRIWTDYDTVRSLVAAGHGEALCWNGEEIRWRHRRFEEGWKPRHSDVAVVKLPFAETVERTVHAFAAWRDWLASYGASPTGTTGSAAWSLLRAKLAAPLWTSIGAIPPIAWTLGGRQELGPAGQGHFDGLLTQLDLPAAYASELGNLRYGGHWHLASDLPARDAAWWAQEGRPVFCRAIVKVPECRYGPLPRRPRKPQHGGTAAVLGSEYPTGCRMQGCWTYQELEAAERRGVRIVKVIETYVHLSASRPFLPWWDAILEGRKMPGLAGLLAKTTGNALWGRFAMSVHTNGTRTIRGADGKGRLTARPFPFLGGLPGAHDLAETVSGRVRSKLYDAMEIAGADLLSAHTDGIWSRASARLDELDEWRQKQNARELWLLDPQVLRYKPVRGRVQTVFAGVPAGLADQAFDEEWSRRFHPAAA